MTSTPLIRTKLHRPSVPLDAVDRVRLIDVMENACKAPLTLVSAPAGYGKSVLAAQWAERCDTPVAWLSLDESESDLQLFLQYFIASVHTVLPEACPSTEDLLSAPELPPVSVLAGSILNDLDAMDRPCAVVLDDYHRIEISSPVHELIGLMLEHPPRGVHLVLITRRDPPLPLATLLAAGLVTEVRLEELQFTEPETAEFLSNSTTLAIGDDVLARLQRQVEGWAAGLRLTALALRLAADREALVKSLTGGLLQTREYLLHEVLSGLSSEDRECLLTSSILDRFCPRLLEAVCFSHESSAARTGSGRAFVDMIQRNNLFVAAIDDEGEWFRYHHLFRDLLQRELRNDMRDQELAALHIRASEWFESEGLISEAIDHALAGGNVLGAAETIEQNRRAELDEDRWYVIERWINRLPDEVTQQRPGLLLARAWVALHRFQLIELPPLLDRVTSLLADDDDLRAELLVLQGSLQFFLGDAESSVRSCEEAAGRLTGERGLIRGHLEMFLNLARSMRGEPVLALRSLEDGLRRAGSAPGIYTSRLMAGIGFISQTSGDLDRVKRGAGRLRTLAAKDGIAYTETIGTYMEAWAHLHAFELDRACRDFARATGRSHILHARTAVDAIAGLALTHQLLQQHGESETALDCLQDFARDDPLLLSVAESSRARLDLLRGNLSSALEWARSGDLAPQPLELYIWLEVPAITRAKVLIEAGTKESLCNAIDLLEAIRRMADPRHFTNQRIDITVLQSLALEKQGHTGDAVETLREAVDLAAPGGWVRPFIEAGPAMAAMLESLIEESNGVDFIRLVLAAFAGRAPGAAASVAASVSTPVPSTATRSATHADLTNRELDVLELLAERLRNKEIAARLGVSTHTVNYHLKSIYSKLGVDNRRQAVAAAIQTGLFQAT